jgi:hypothetical protein
MRAERTSCFGPRLFSFGQLWYSLRKPWRKFLLLAAACALVGSVTVFVVERGNFSPVLHHHAGPLARDIRDEDRKFLDDLVQKQDQHAVLGGNPLSAPVKNIANTGMIGSGNELVPKAELVINSEIVKRAELVVHSGTIKRAELVQPRHQ